MAEAVQITKLGGQSAMRRQDSGKIECREIFSKRIHDERAEKCVRYRGMLNVMNSGFVLTAIIRNPDEDNNEIPGDL